MPRLPMIMIPLLMFYGCSHSMAPVGHYQDTQVTADGNISDWTLPLKFTNDDYTMQYAVTNDKKNIYVCVYTKDDATQQRILKAGMTLYFDPRGEKNKEKSLVFPIRKVTATGNGHNNGDPIRNTDPVIEKNQYLLESNYYNTTGFSHIENGQFGINDSSSNIRLGIQLNRDSSLVYEAMVPVKDIFGSDLTTTTAGKNFSVGIAIGVVRSAQTNRNASGYRPSYGGGGMHGMHMGGMGGGGGQRGYHPANNTPPADQEIWYSFRPALKKS